MSRQQQRAGHGRAGTHGHGHGHGTGGDRVRVPPRTTALLAVLVALLGLGTAVGAALLWPRGETATLSPAQTFDQDPITATVQQVSERTCPGLGEDRLPDGSVPESVRCGSVTVRLEEGQDEGRTTTVDVTSQTLDAGLGVGSSVEVARLPVEATPEEPGPVYAFVDFSRALPLTVLAVVFAALVVAVARLRGVAALAGLVLGYLTILEFMLPALQAGRDPALVAFVGCTLIMIVILYLAHGVSAKTTTALLGTVAGLAVTAVLARWAVGAAHLTGQTGEESLTLSQLVGPSTLSGVVLCGLILAGLGILNDVTVTQASAVWELREHAPHLGRGRLFASGMRIGRDHLSSTVYTVVFAYSGAALPTLLLIQLYSRPLGQVLTTGEIAEEVARTLVGGIGLILAIPLTTGIGALVVGAATVPGPAAPSAPPAPSDRPDRPDPDDGAAGRPGGNGSGGWDGATAWDEPDPWDGPAPRRRDVRARGRGSGAGLP